jgi:cyanobactin maturation PatA/PatG family protease
LVTVKGGGVRLTATDFGRVASAMNESNFMRLWGSSQVETADAVARAVEFSSGTERARPSEHVSGGQTKWSVPPLAKMAALGERAHLQESDLPSEAVCLSRFAYLRPLCGALVIESPLSQFRITLTDPRAGNLLLELSEPRLVKTLGEIAGLPAGLAREFMQLLWQGSFLTAGPEPPELQAWDFHNLVFHGRKRWHDSAPVPANSRKGNTGSCPVVKLPMSTNGKLLHVPSLDSATGSGPTLTAVMEARRSIRSVDDAHPITLEQLGELLYRTGRVRSIFKSRDKFGHLANSDSADQETVLSERPYPAGGARYELELYPVVRHCAGLDAGLYHYDPLNHRLEKLKDGQDADVLALIEDAFDATGRQGMPQVLLIVAARFGRMFEAYQCLGYSLVLKNVGVLFQNLYLVATAMKLAPCALGEGDVERFGRVTGLEFLDETMVGGFIVGTASDESSQVATAGFERPSIAETSETAAAGAVPLASPLPTDAQLATLARHPHDLDDRLPGLRTLRDKTLGNSRITVVILDGDPDLALSCFRGGHVSKKYPFWHERAEPITAEQHALYRQISERDLKKEETQRQLTAAFSPPVLNRIMGDRHATHITSTIAGQPGSPAPGIAPECRVIVVPLNELGDPGEIMSALNLARGFSLAYELKADIIHCAICVPTQTDQPHDLLARAVKTCLDDGILIVAPVGNEGGDCRCIPAVLPGTLAVGALKDDGQPFKFTNWGGNYSTDGIMGPGERILCAQPRTERPTRQKGTSLAAPIVTGVAALLMSRQLQVGRKIDAKAIREALLSTARACDSAVVEEPERCLRGVIDLPAAMDVLFGSPRGIGVSSNFARLFEDSAIARQSGTSRNSSVDATPNTDGEEAVSPVASAADTEAVIHLSAAEPAGGSGSADTAAYSVKQSTAHSGLVYALGRLSFDLASEIGKQTLEQRMAQGVKDGELRGANPNEPRDLIEYLDKNPTERRFIIWTLELDGAPVYALKPKGPYADQIYEHLLVLLAGQILPEHAPEFIEQVSIPARRTGQVVELLSRAKIPVIALTNVRGIHGWPVNALVSDALASAIPAGSSAQDYEALRNALANFLKRVYFDLHNYGLTSRDRAMNYAATNCCQAASVFVKALAEGRILKTIAVDKSPVCRMHSDCWEIYLTFDDPDNEKRATRVFHFTVDVSDTMPVTVGAVKSWTRMTVP